MINWSKYFDKIICINYSNYKNRKQLLLLLFKRVGILDSGIFEWHTTFQDTYLNSIKNLTNIEYSISYLSDTKGHIDAIKKAYYEGCLKILILEDDIRFLRDLDKIELILLNLPNNNLWLIILLNKCPLCSSIKYFNTIKERKNLINKYFCKSCNMILFSAGCYCLNRKGMLNMFENYNINNYEIIDRFWNFNSIFKKVLFSIKTLAVQISFQKCVNYTHTLPNNNFNFLKATLQLQNSYKIQNINFDDYMMKIDGSKYDYGDYIKE